MELKSLINNLTGGNTKTASDTSTEKVAQPDAQPSTLDARMREVVAAAGREKNAAAGETLQSVLAKEAQAFSDANDEAFLRRMKLGGAAFAESALSSFDRAGQAADAVIKEASANLDPEFVELVKMAQANPGNFLAEVRAGYEAGLGQNQKQAQYEAAVHGWATDHYIAGYESVRRAIGA